MTWGPLLSRVTHEVKMYNSTEDLPIATLPASTYAYRPIYHIERETLLPGICSDVVLALLAPVFIYWAVAGVFHLIDYLELPYFEKHRIHESKEITSRNKVTISDVVKAVIIQQSIQTILGLSVLDEEVHTTGAVHAANLDRYSKWLAWTILSVFGSRSGQRIMLHYGPRLTLFTYWWFIPALQFLWGFFALDTWQYFLHRAFHTNKWLYRKIHSTHHRLYVPYACGALYNHPAEGFLFDSLGGILAQLAAGMTTRQALVLFTVSTAKTVDDHCGYALPWDPFQALCGNNADYHDIHHQQFGIKKNFSQPWFMHWDVFLGTRMTRDQAPRRQHTDTRDPKVQKVDQSLQSNGHGHNPKMVNGYANGHAKIE